MKQMTLMFLSMALCLLIVGCGPAPKPTGSVSGQVIFNGTPLKLGYVSFKDSTAGVGISGKIDSSGNFTFDEPIPAANYQVTITRPTVAPDEPVTPEIKNFPVPEKYANPATSGLTAEVKTGPNTFKFEVKK